MNELRDIYRRPVKDLRISVTDRCNLRCTYCMPFDEYDWIDKQEILTFEEITRLARLFVWLGVEKIRLTGGEPLVRKELDQLISQLSTVIGVKDICLTTNGLLLADQVAALKAAGLRRVNVSLDTLDAERFKRITQRTGLDKVLDGLFAAKRHGLHPIKVNAVIERGVNEADIIPLVVFSKEHGFGLRFIEYMDVGNSNDWSLTKTVSKKEIWEIIAASFPLREVGRDADSDTAVRYQLADGGGDIGIIASVTEPFCSGCTRARITADGKLVTCLFSSTGHDLKTLMRGGASDEDILEVINRVWSDRRDKYSDDRLDAIQSGRGYEPTTRKKIEMISLGG
jgi:cyclic pyranopterin phosphate synthase